MLVYKEVFSRPFEGQKQTNWYGGYMYRLNNLFPYLISEALSGCLTPLLSEKQQFLEFQQLEEVLLLSRCDYEGFFVGCDVIDDRFVLGWRGLDENDGENHQQALRGQIKRPLTRFFALDQHAEFFVSVIFYVTRIEITPLSVWLVSTR